MIAGRGLEAEIIGCPRDVAAGAGATTAIAAEGSREALTSTQEGVEWVPRPVHGSMR